MKKIKTAYKILIGFAVLVLLILKTGPVFIVNEGEQVVVTRFGQIVKTYTEAGLHVKMPVIDTVVTYPKLILSLDGDSQRIPTKENQFIIVDTTAGRSGAGWSTQFEQLKRLQHLSDIIDSSTRTVITQNRLSEIVRSSNIINEKPNGYDKTENAQEIAEIESLVNVSTVNESVLRGRNDLCLQMTEEANKSLLEYGINLLDIVPRQIKYSNELTESVYNRMIKERNQVAQAYRSLGEGKKAEWLGRLENEKRRIRSEAYRKSEETKGKADAEAARIYTESYSKDPEFYEFWKSMESYKNTMKNFDATYSTDMEYFKYLYAPNGRR
ncbi:protease modulator HflC [Treponema parvum]|uniref:protease modulator HflC n=1 Tax=Treponema parvum TaxID=138851 RepID=UPI001AEC4898|nr:protease modulator HflC [Treponema parvum]QTQ15748.1 protease modulator HflC [Treponema parvum]